MGERLIVISNRIPTEDEPSGGLVVALHDCLTQRGGIWIGSSGGPKDSPRDGLYPIAGGAYQRLAFDLNQAEFESYYLGYANSVLWPLFHRRADLMDVQPGFAEGYMQVNRRVARMVADYAEPDDVIWVHDYHFLPLAQYLREAGVTCRIGFFLHIPFPVASDVPALTEAEEFTNWLTAYDVVGLQTEADVNRCRVLFRQMIEDGALPDGPVTTRAGSFLPLVCPIGIDATGYRATAEVSTAGDMMAMAGHQKLVLGVDRLDYSKGLVQRFEGFGAYLQNREDGDPHATLLQIAPTSRENVEAYQDIGTQLDLTAGHINGEYGEIDWTPIRYIRRAVPRDDLAGLYRRADVAMVTPLADGMNLVAKEFVASQDPEDPGVLILSHFAGAAEQLEDALIVNPYDAQDVAQALKQALTMPLEERRARHARLWASVADEDIDRWTDRFLDALASVEPVDRGPGEPGSQSGSAQATGVVQALGSGGAVGETQAEEILPEEFLAHEAQADGRQAGEAQADEAQADEGHADEARADAHPADGRQAGETRALGRSAQGTSALHARNVSAQNPSDSDSAARPLPLLPSASSTRPSNRAPSKVMPTAR